MPAHIDRGDPGLRRQRVLHGDVTATEPRDSTAGTAEITVWKACRLASTARAHDTVRERRLPLRRRDASTSGDRPSIMSVGAAPSPCRVESSAYSQAVASFIGRRPLYRLSDLHRPLLVVYFAIFGPRVGVRVDRLAGSRALSPARPRPPAKRGPVSGGIEGTGTAARIRTLPKRRSFTGRGTSPICIWPTACCTAAHTNDTAAPFPNRAGPLLAAQPRRQPAILLTAYYGPFDLLPLLLGFNGVHCGAVYLSHKNPDFDAYRRHIRGRSGTELIPVQQAISRLPDDPRARRDYCHRGRPSCGTARPAGHVPGPAHASHADGRHARPGVTMRTSSWPASGG